MIYLNYSNLNEETQNQLLENSKKGNRGTVWG